MKNKKIKIRQNKGQSLLEAIIAVGLIMTIVVTSITLSIYTTRVGKISQNRLIAANLAREGIEIFRNVRDSNWLKNRLWDSGIDASDDYILEFELYKCGNGVLDPGEECDPDVENPPLDGDVNNCSSICTLEPRPDGSAHSLSWQFSPAQFSGANTIDNCTNCLLYISDSGIYNHNSVGNKKTRFHRMVTLSGPDPIQIISRIKWKEDKRNQYVVLEETLTNWRYE